MNPLCEVSAEELQDRCHRALCLHSPAVSLPHLVVKWPVCLVGFFFLKEMPPIMSLVLNLLQGTTFSILQAQSFSSKDRKICFYLSQSRPPSQHGSTFSCEEPSSDSKTPDCPTDSNTKKRWFSQKTKRNSVCRLNVHIFLMRNKDVTLARGRLAVLTAAKSCHWELPLFHEKQQVRDKVTVNFGQSWTEWPP